METLRDGEIPFLVGGAYAFTPFTGIPRSTKDFDVFVAKDDITRALAVLRAGGFDTELTFPHWLGKAFQGRDFVDLIFSSGNGVAPVDHNWFDHAPRGEVLGVDVLLAPAEEMLWSKAFVMERERYDGGDVIHLLRARAEQLDWPRVLERFGPYWRVLLSYLLLFGFVYPGERTRVPAWVMRRAARPAGARGRHERRDRAALSGDDHLAAAVPARRDGVGLHRRAADAARQHERRGDRQLDGGHRREEVGGTGARSHGPRPRAHRAETPGRRGRHHGHAIGRAVHRRVAAMRGARHAGRARGAVRRRRAHQQSDRPAAPRGGGGGASLLGGVPQVVRQHPLDLPRGARERRPRDARMDERVPDGRPVSRPATTA
jgi:hypothetical protein